MEAKPDDVLDAEKPAEIERKYDPETAFRPVGKHLAIVITTALVAMSVYHFLCIRLRADP